jgi:hypothetical protein
MNIRVTTLALAVMLAVPIGAAWSGKGSYEPDTSYDKTGPYMWQTADTGANTGNRVYFNAYTQQNTGYSTHGFDLGFNLATAQFARPSWPGNLAALLGVWKDCNKDGFIGLGDQGIMEYRSELLIDTTACPPNAAGQAPPGSGPAPHNWAGALIHNDGIWVREFVPIGPDSVFPSQGDANPYDITDNGARVWGDWGVPGALPPPTSCSVVFIPTGTFHSTGYFLWYADCSDGYVVTDTIDIATSTAGQGQLGFSDHPRDQFRSQSPLNQPDPWGDPGGASDAQAWDCSHGTIAHVQITSTIGVGVSPPSSNPKDRKSVV